MPILMKWCVLPLCRHSIKPACIKCMLRVHLVPACCVFHLPQQEEVDEQEEGEEEDGGRFNHGQGQLAVIGTFVLL